MSRYIDTDALKKCITEYCASVMRSGGMIGKKFMPPIHDDLMDVIDEQPTVQRWIPVSERLPEEEYDILCLNGRVGNITYDHAVCTDGFYENKQFYLRGVLLPDSVEVLAWMPLPEGYKEEEK